MFEEVLGEEAWEPGAVPSVKKKCTLSRPPLAVLDKKSLLVSAVLWEKGLPLLGPGRKGPPLWVKVWAQTVAHQANPLAWPHQALVAKVVVEPDLAVLGSALHHWGMELVKQLLRMASVRVAEAEHAWDHPNVSLSGHPNRVAEVGPSRAVPTDHSAGCFGPRYTQPTDHSAGCLGLVQWMLRYTQPTDHSAGCLGLVQWMLRYTAPMDHPLPHFGLAPQGLGNTQAHDSHPASCHFGVAVHVAGDTRDRCSYLASCQFGLALPPPENTLAHPSRSASCHFGLETMHSVGGPRALVAPPCSLHQGIAVAEPVDPG